MSVDLPNILIVDDENGASFQAALADLARTRALHPKDVELDDLRWADLVLMDYFIQSWPTRDDLSELGLRPPNGLALAAVLREHLDDQSSDDDHDYTAFAVHTSHIGDISKRLHTSSRAPHVVARLNNLEWAFDKGDKGRFVREATLASGVREVSQGWSAVAADGLPSLTSELLRLPGDQNWSERALDDVQLCQVPMSVLSAGSNGLTFLRWLAHTILPYPTFLWDEHWVATRLRITVAGLRQVLEGDSELAQRLRALRYDGVLAGFLGERWWKGAVEQFAWQIRAKGASSAEEFHARLQEMAQAHLERLSFSSPVVCVGRDLAPTGVVEQLESTVRLVPDLWPSYADMAHAEIALVREDAQLRALVHPLDRDAVEPEESE
ncbi:MAG: hypothetical protein R3F61_33950 [Myxococcota bacterium]